MQLVIGGAFSGKRKIVKETNVLCSWVSAYQGDRLEDWETHWLHGTTLVIEGWEKWIADELTTSENNDDIRSVYKVLFQTLLEEEQRRKSKIVLIILEMGKGIVPLQRRIEGLEILQVGLPRMQHSFQIK